MKQLVCEMCGGTDLVKDGGVFVCQNCGCKYSIEEAKKMMVEGTVEVQGAVQVTNTAQFENLVKLANEALRSGNSAEAEKQANLALAIKSDDYDALMIKARAIDGQTTGKKSRFEEAYNCYLNAFSSLPEEERKSHYDDFCSEVDNFFLSEVRFWVNQIEAQRPTDATIDKARNTLLDMNKNALAMSALTSPYRTSESSGFSNLNNCFVSAVSKMAHEAWNSTVGYNYYRESLSNLGSNWRRNGGEDRSSVFHPGDNVFTTFYKEIDLLISIMRFAVNLGTRSSDPLYATCETLYDNMAFLMEQKAEAVSFHEYSYSSSYTAYNYYKVHYSWNADQKKRMLSEAKEYREKAQEMKKLAKEKKIADYWKEHAEEKKALDEEKESLVAQVDALTKEQDAVPGWAELKEKEEQVKTLSKERGNLSVFKGKERRALQEKIDGLNAEIKTLSDSVAPQRNAFQEQIDSKQKRISEIDAELTKDR